MKQKKCRKCKETLDIIDFPNMNLWKYWVWSTCIECISENHSNYVIKRNPIEVSRKPINKVSKTNKNTPARFTQETKDEIKARDKKCINKACINTIQQYHHVYFWANANRWSNRNSTDQWVWLCSNCHYEIHHWISWIWKILRARCILYVQEL